MRDQIIENGNMAHFDQAHAEALDSLREAGGFVLFAFVGEEFRAILALPGTDEERMGDVTQIMEFLVERYDAWKEKAA